MIHPSLEWSGSTSAATRFSTFFSAGASSTTAAAASPCTSASAIFFQFFLIKYSFKGIKISVPVPVNVACVCSAMRNTKRTASFQVGTVNNVRT